MSIKPKADRLQAELTSYLQAGQRELEAGKETLADAGTKHDVTLVAQAVRHFATAKGQFVAASQLADHSDLLRYLESVPAAGTYARSRHTTADGLAAMGVALSDAGQGSADVYTQLIKPTGTEASRTVLAMLDSTSADRTRVLADLQRALDAASQVDPNVMPGGLQGSFLKARDTINAAISSLKKLEHLVPVLNELLGGMGVRTYLVEQVNPAELRAGGGFIGTYSLLRADHGALTLIRTGNASELAEPRPSFGTPAFVDQPGPFREIVPNVSWSFLDSNLFPDFPANAIAAERWVQPRLPTRIDGVIAVDYHAVARMLAQKLAGPIDVPDFGTTVNEDNFISVVIAHDIAHDLAYKSFLAAIATPLMARLTGLRPDRWSALVETLNDLASSRHIQAYFNSGTVESEMVSLGLAGTINPASADDYVMEIESNYYGDKANYFVTRHFTLELSRNGNSFHHKLTVDLFNAMPCNLMDRTSYRVNLRVYVPEAATNVSDNMRRVKYPNPAPPVGLKLVDGWVPDRSQGNSNSGFPEIACGGGRGKVVLQYDTRWSDVAGGVHRVYWQKQPGTNADVVDILWDQSSRHTYLSRGDLSQDLLVLISTAGITLTQHRTSLNFNMG